MYWTKNGVSTGMYSVTIRTWTYKKSVYLHADNCLSVRTIWNVLQKKILLMALAKHLCT